MYLKNILSLTLIEIEDNFLIKLQILLEGQMRERAAYLSRKTNQIVEMLVAILMAALVLDVWLGVLDRYLFHWQLPWPEVLARYLMIWAAMLAVSSGIARREHIGLTTFIAILPSWVRRLVLITMDLIALALFAYLLDHLFTHQRHLSFIVRFGLIELFKG